jgi:hypothetical protein
VDKFIGNDDLENMGTGSRDPLDAETMRQYCSIELDRVHVMHNLGSPNLTEGPLAAALARAAKARYTAEVLFADSRHQLNDQLEESLLLEARAQEISEMKQKHEFENTRPTDVAEAAYALGLDGETLQLEGTTFAFKPWQVLGMHTLSKDLNV